MKRVPRAARNASARSRGAPHLWKDYIQHSIHISLRGALLACLAALALGYSAGVALIHQRLEAQNSHNRVGYLDLALPHRWSRLERLRGESQIAQAGDLLAANRTREGLALLRSGLARHPADFATRHDLARIYVGARLAPRAIALLMDGLDYGYPGRDYLATLFALVKDADRSELQVETVRRARDGFQALPTGLRTEGDAAWLDQQLVLALLDANRTTEAVTWLEDHLPETDLFGREITLVHLLDTDRPNDALSLARRWIAEQPASPEALRLLARAHRQLGDSQGLDDALSRLRAIDPTRPDALLYALVQNHLADRPGAARLALDELIFRHGGDPGLYGALATASANARFMPGLERVQNESRERGFSAHPALWAYLRLALRDADWPATLAYVEALRTSRGPAFTDIQTHYLETMRRLALACIEGASGTQSSLVEMVATRPGTLPLYRQILEALLAAGRPDTARDILTLADGPYPDSTTLATLRPRIESAMLAAATADASRPALAHEFSSLEAFGEHLQTLEPAQGLAAFSALRRASPDWVPVAAAQLEALELPLRARADDPLALQVLVRARLARDSDAPGALLTLARELDAEKHPAHALLLVQEILRRQPDNPFALDQLRAWTPAPAPSAAKPAEPSPPPPARI